jgi:rubredoxin
MKIDDDIDFNYKDYWKCQSCGETIEANFDTCWNCQKARTEDIRKTLRNETQQYNSDVPIDAHDYWKCPKCGQIIALNSDFCWNCKSKQPVEIEHPTLMDIFQYQSVEEGAKDLQADDYWKCPSCGQTIEIVFDACWSCQNSKPDHVEQPAITEIIKYQSYKKPVSFTKSGFTLIGSGIVLIFFSGINPISEALGYERTYYGRFIFGVFFIIVGVFFLIVGFNQKDK